MVLYQLDLSWKLKPPVILHVRDALEDAQRLLDKNGSIDGRIHRFLLVARKEKVK